MNRLVVPLLLLWAVQALPAQAGEARVAVAANFSDPATEIARRFSDRTGHRARLSFGASGAFYAQITQGAPFEVFLSADASRPARAVEEGFGVPGSVFTYAIGQLVLWSREPDLVTGPETLERAAFAHIAIADPKAAPYGAAAVEAMKALGVYDALAPKLVQGTSISQAFQFVETGNAALGFVALSQVKDAAGSRWVLPRDLHAPILQDAVLLEAGARNEAARAFLDFLKGPEAQAAILSHGYALGPAPGGVGG